MKNVIVYSTPTCPHCVRAKQFLRDNNIEFKDVDISKDQSKVQEAIKKSGQMGVPVLDIEGDIVIGFDKGKITKLLGL